MSDYVPDQAGFHGVPVRKMVFSAAFLFQRQNHAVAQPDDRRDAFRFLGMPTRPYRRLDTKRLFLWRAA